MSEDIVYHPHPDLTNEENSYVTDYINEEVQREIDHPGAELATPLPERLNNFTSAAESWMVENYFKPAGLSEDDIRFPAFVRNKPTGLGVYTQFGISPSMSKGVYVDLYALNVRFNDPDIFDYMAARTIIEEVYHHTGTQNIRATVEEQNDEKNITVDVSSKGLSFKHKGKPVNATEEGMAQLFAEKAETFLKEQFPKGYEKIEELRKPENKGAMLIDLKNGSPTWKKLYEGPTKLAREIVNHGLSGDIGLVESARIKGEHLGMAHKLKSTYGEDVYKKIMTVSHNQASDLAEELANKH